MKKSLFLTIWTAFLTIFFFTGCNLYLDEDNTPQEEKGYDAPVHIKTDTLEMTYQFNEGVKQLTQNVQQYLEKVEADSILCFTNGTPYNYLPKTGEYVCAELSEKLPTGLLGYVVRAGFEDGYYKVFTTGASLKEIFKTLKLEVEKPLNWDNTFVLPDTSVTDSTLFVSNDTTDYLRVPSDYQLPSVDTRSGEDDDDNSSMKEETETTTWEICLDTRKIKSETADLALQELISMPKVPKKLLGAMKFAGGKHSKLLFNGKGNITKNRRWYGAFTYKRVNKETVHCAIDLDKEEMEYWKEDKTDHTVSIEGGYSFGAETEKRPGRWLYDKKEFSEKVEGAQTIDGPELCVPICAWLGFLVTTSLEINFDTKICGVGTYTHTTIKKTGAAYRNGELKLIDYKPPTSENSWDFDFVGSAKLETTFHIGVGLRGGKKIAGFSATVDALIGGFATAGLEAKYSLDIDRLVEGKKQINDNTYARFYVDIGPELNFRVNFAKYNLLDKKIPLAVFHPVNKKWTLYPSVDDKSIKVVNDQYYADDDLDKTRFDMEMKYSSPGILVRFMNSTMSPFMRIYKGVKVVQDQVPPKEATSSTWPIQKSPDFVYTYSLDNLQEDVLYRAVPCFFYNGEEFEQEDHAYYFTSTSPYISLKNNSGTKEQVLYRDWGSQVSFYFVLQLDVIGVSKMKKWGIHIEVKNKNSGRKVYNKRVPVNLLRSKFYTLGLEFTTKMKNLEFTFKPYAYVVKNNGETELKYYPEEAVVLNSDLSLDTDERRNEWNNYSFDKVLSPEAQ